MLNDLECKYKNFFLITKFFFYFCKKLQIMKKENRGRKPIPESEKKKVIQIFIKQKHLKQAKEECKLIEKKYAQ
jgi:hypothetical protein